jgi:hypothetical protein
VIAVCRAVKAVSPIEALVSTVSSPLHNEAILRRDLMNATNTTTRTAAVFAAAALSLVLAVPTFAADADAPASPANVHEQMMAQIRELQNRSQQGQWINHWMPAATRMMDHRESADDRLQAIVAGYDRATLDRGAWCNAVLAGNHYAAAEPLLSTALGSGVTTPGADATLRTALIAKR